MMPARDIPTRTQIALLIAFAANGLRGIERHARNHILEHIGLPVPASDERRVSAIFDDITPRPKAGRVRLDRCGDNVASTIVGPSDRIQLAMLAYLTRGGTLLGPLMNPIKIFNEEFQESCVAGTRVLSSDSRLGALSNLEFRREKERATEIGELWAGATWRHPSEIAIAALSKYGTLCPAILDWHSDELVASLDPYRDDRPRCCDDEPRPNDDDTDTSWIRDAVAQLSSLI